MPKKKRSKKDPPASAPSAAAVAAPPSEPPEPRNDDDDDEGSLDIGACCLCHCALDYSDKAAFDSKDRHEDYSDCAEDEDKGNDADDDNDSYFFRKNDPYLPPSLYDANNALLYCDSCPRLFHQQCHFVPVLHFSASKPWHCLICQVRQEQKQLKKKHKKSHAAANKNKTTTMMLPLKKYPLDMMFQSPPIPSAAPFEQQWEHDPQVIRVKAMALHQQLAAVGRALQTPIAAHKRAITALETLTATSRNRAHFAENNNYNSQELKQCIYTVTAQKYRIRQLFCKLERVRHTAAARHDWNQVLLPWVNNHSHGNSKAMHAEFVQRVLFPFGSHYPRRWFPVTPEYREAEAAQELQQQQQIPTEVIVATNNNNNNKTASRKTLPKPPPAASAAATLSKKPAAAHKHNDDDDDDDEGFSLDDLQCCVCLQGDSTDDNDMILCDGHGCYRAYHAQCVHPHVQIDDEEDEDSNWFCPLCQCMALTLLKVQAQVSGGDDWEHRRMMVHPHHSKPQGNDDDDDDDDADSLKSWAVAADVFPEAAADLETARQLKQGVTNRATAALVAKVLGDDDER